MNMPGISVVDEKKQKLNELIKKKSILEDLIEVYKEQSHHGEKLIDLEGFPRNDLDLVAIRTGRNRFVCTQNDHKNLMKQIENALLEYHQAQKNVATQPKFSDTPPSKDWQPFAIVHHVKVKRFIINVSIKLNVIKKEE